MDQQIKLRKQLENAVLCPSLRKILLRNAIVGSKYGNCMIFDSEDSVGSIFSLKWSRQHSSVVEEADLDEVGQDRISALMFQLESTNLTFYQEEILDTLQIWDLINGEWTCTASWKAHSGVVRKVIWAYPEFGQVLATCSYDRTVAVWKELPTDEGQDGGHWVKRGNLVDSRSSIVDVKFAPRHHGLKLAMCSVDGNIRIYEAPDVMNLCQWNLQNEIVCKVSCMCVAWSPSRSWIKADSISMIPCPVRDLSFSPNLGRLFELLGVAGRDVSILQIKPVTTRKEGQGQAGPLTYEIRSVTQFNDHQAQVWRLSWNITGTILASGDDGCVRLWKGNYMDNWRCIAVLKSGISGVQPEPLKISETFGGAGTVEEKSVVFHSALRSSHSSTTANSTAPVWH